MNVNKCILLAIRQKPINLKVFILVVNSNFYFRTTVFLKTMLNYYFLKNYVVRKENESNFQY